MDTQLSLRRLEILCLVIDEGGVTRAAEHLLVAQPAVSSQLRALEKWLGAQLFARNGNKLILTEAGHRAYAWAKEVLALSAQVQRDVQELGAGTAGTVVIASSMAVGSYLLPPILTRLRLERPGADITVHADQPAAALHAVEAGDADFAVLTMSDQDLPATISEEHLRDEPIVLCAGPGQATDTEELSLREVAALPCVGVPRTVAFHEELQAQLRAHDIRELNVVVRLGHAEPMKRAAVDNGWVTLLPRYCVADDLRAGRLREVRIRDAQLVERIGLYHRSTAFFSPLQQAALAAIRAEIRQA